MLRTTGNGKLLDLATTCCEGHIPGLVRYPILANTYKQREFYYQKLDQGGLGVSRMYQHPLTAIEGLENILKGQGPFPNAEQFADTLLTLPTHAGLTRSHIEQIKQIFLKTTT